MDFFQRLEFTELVTIITLALNYWIILCFSLINFPITFHHLFTMTKYHQCLSIWIVVIPYFGITSCIIWTTKILQFKLFFFFCPQHSMVIFYSKSLHYALVIYLHCRCKAWIESTMAMFGQRLLQPISKIFLVLVSGRLAIWVTCVVLRPIVIAQSISRFAMRLPRSQSWPNFQWKDMLLDL
jgi:hypothetical protein